MYAYMEMYMMQNSLAMKMDMKKRGRDYELEEICGI